jgi:hypothetical protein
MAPIKNCVKPDNTGSNPHAMLLPFGTHDGKGKDLAEGHAEQHAWKAWS